MWLVHTRYCPRTQILSGFVRRFRSRMFVMALCMMGLILGAEPSDAFINRDRISTAKAVAHYAMGQMYDMRGLTNRAVMEYEKAAQFDDGSYLIHLRLGADYARLDLLEDSKKQLYRVAKLNPEDLQSHYLLALIHSTLKDYDKAAEEYELILTTFSKAEPQNIEIYGYLGQLYYSQKKYDQAILQFEKILELEPLNADVMYLLGALYLEVDNEDRAVELLKRSIGIDPEHDGSLNTLGYAYAKNGESLDEAEELIDRALEISPNNGAYLDSLGWVYYQKGKYELALEVFTRADEILKNSEILDHMGDTYYKLNRFDEAIEQWTMSLEMYPDQKNVIKKIDDVKNIQVNNHDSKKKTR